MKPRTLQRIIWIAAALAGIGVLAGLLLSLLAFQISEGGVNLAPHQLFNPLMTLGFCVVGGLVASNHPRNPIGWLLGSTGILSSIGLLALGYGNFSEAISSSQILPGAQIARWFDSWVWLPQIGIPLTFILLLFPDGKLMSSRWRVAAWLAGLGLITAATAYMIAPGFADDHGIETPYRSIVASLETVGYSLLGISMIASISSLVVRFRRAQGQQRDQLKWLAYGTGVVLLTGFIVEIILAIAVQPAWMEEASIIWTCLLVLSIVIAVGIAMIRYQLYDIDLMINRTLVYSTLSGLLAITYLLVIGLLGALLNARNNLFISLIGVGLVAIVVQPVRERLQQAANRLIYGERNDPYAVLARLGEHLESALAPNAILTTLVETIAQSLRLPYVGIALRNADENNISAAYGQSTTESERFPLVFQGEIIGDLLAAPRGFGESFHTSERNLLATIARQAGAAVHAAQLTLELQRSRARLVTTREEERRRLRRELHDGVGPTLAALHLQVGTLRRQIRGEPDQAVQMAAQLQTEIRVMIDSIRQLAYELRPPALDELGLIGAIHSRATQISRGDYDDNDTGERQSTSLDIQVSAQTDLPPLPAAVEVAAYRITLEALLNALRHAQASMCTVHVSVSDNLCLEIRDNGMGLPTDHHVGVGILSMRERAAELGGWCLIEANPDGGTLVQARLPLLTHG